MQTPGGVLYTVIYGYYCNTLSYEHDSNVILSSERASNVQRTVVLAMHVMPCEVGFVASAHGLINITLFIEVYGEQQ